MESVKKFEREERYIVVKLKHLAGLQVAPLRNFLRENRVPQIECVVVEHDWPEYNLVWAMLEHRMAGKPVPDFNQWRRAEALQLLLNERDEQLTSLEQRRHAEQQACQAAERRVKELEAAMGQVQSLCMSFPEKAIGMKAHSVRQMLDIATRALNPTAEAVSHDRS